MPASPTATPEHIKDVNTRYHDAAADEYDAKWGIDFGATGQEQVRPKLVKALGGLDGQSFGDGLEIGSGTGYFSLNLLQLGVIERLTATDISPGMLQRLANTAERARARGRDGRRPRPRSCPSRTRASTSSSATPSSTTSPTSRRPSPNSAACCDRAARSPSPASPRATATASRRCRSGPGLLVAPAWRRLVGAQPRAVAEAEQSEGHALEGEVDVHAFAPADLRRLLRDAGFEERHVGGEELLANAWGWGLRTVESSAEPESVSWGWRSFAFRSYIALQKVDTRLLEPHLPAELFYNLLVSGRKPA